MPEPAHGRSPTLTCNEISFSFPSKKILDRVSLNLQPGAITCLLGGNGAGKTTLFNLITGFLRVDTGSLSLDGINLNGRAPFSISRLGVARTFQDLRLIGKITVQENVMLAIPHNPGEKLGTALLPKQLCRERDAEDHRKADTLLAEYFLTDVADQLASEISYGQQKLLTLACCTAMDARLILLDEPVAGISPEYREQITERLTSLKASGKTIFLIEHQPDFLECVGDDFLFLQTGRLHQFDTLAQLRVAPIAHDALN